MAGGDVSRASDGSSGLQTRPEDVEKAGGGFSGLTQWKRLLRRLFSDEFCLYRAMVWLECSVAKATFVIGFSFAMLLMFVLYDLEKRIDDKLKAKFGYTTAAAERAQPLLQFSCLLSLALFHFCWHFCWQ